MIAVLYLVALATYLAIGTVVSKWFMQAVNEKYPTSDVSPEEQAFAGAVFLLVAVFWPLMIVLLACFYFVRWLSPRLAALGRWASK